MYIFVLVIFLLSSFLLIGIIMLQNSKGVLISSSFNSSSSSMFFNSTSSSNFINKLTAIFAILFFLTSLILGNLISNKKLSNKLDNVENIKKIRGSIKNTEVLDPKINDIPN